ncbi:MAG: nitrous oxide-stimulated promoter family protein [Candidatus Riflebacteria bacterium]|nr:nitrous oxide-stimulated promoter family protein [Candidatus Riflebacteria bacterium]
MERRPQPMTPARLRRERRTMAAMIDLYCCEKHGCCHGPGRSCGPCGELLAYALARLSHCPFGRHKPTCSRCPIHCYRPEWRERVREVMRFAGPRLLLHRPLLALTHLLDGLRPKNP